MILIFIGTAVAALLGLLLWSTGRQADRRQVPHLPATLNLSCSHLQHLAQIRQALDVTDLDYLSKRFDAAKLRTVKKERRLAVKKYLSGLKEDFDHLMDTAQIVASLSPEVEATEEWKRFKLATRFRINYAIVQTKFTLGSAAFPSLENLANIVGSLELELERVVGEIALSLTPGEPGSAQG